MDIQIKKVVQLLSKEKGLEVDFIEKDTYTILEIRKRHSFSSSSFRRHKLYHDIISNYNDVELLGYISIGMDTFLRDINSL